MFDYHLQYSLCHFIIDTHRQKQLDIHQSPKNNNSLFNIRLFCLIYMTIIFLWQLTFTKSLSVCLIGMLEWGYIGTLAYFLLSIQHYYLYNTISRENKQNQKLKYFIQILYEFIFSVTLPITVIFWGYILHYLLLAIDMNQYLKKILFPYVLEYLTVDIIVLNVNLHIGPLVCLIIQLPYNPFSFSPYHFIFISLISVFYLMINMSYTLAVAPAYLPMDWVSLQSYFICLISIIMTIGMFLIGRLWYEYFKKQKLSDSKEAHLMEPNSQIQII